MAGRKEWFAVFASVAIIGALVGLVFLTGQTVRGQLLPLQPWYLYEGATLTWEVQRDRLGEPQEGGPATFRVKEVANTTIVLYQEGGGQTLNETLSHEHMEGWWSTLAAQIAFRGLRYRNVTYRATLMTYDAGGQSFAALNESGSYEIIGLGLVTVERVTDLTTFALLYANESLRIELFGDPPRWFNDTRRLTSFHGIEPTAVDRMDVFEMRFEDSSTLVHAFNAPDLSIDAQNSAVNVAFVSAQEALIASLIDRRTVPVLDVAPGNASQSLMPINETHSLLRVRTSPGSFQFTLTLGQEPAMVEAPTSLSLGSGDALVRPGRRRPSP
ncbi:MAG: hypothetical protein V3U30_00590 [Thermoplasmata archaeon]